MFDAVRNNKKIVQLFLLLITLPFAFWGVDSYIRGSGGGNDLAVVGGVPIRQADFDQAIRDQQERMRAALGERYDPTLLDTPEARRAVLEQLVNKRLLALDVAKLKLGVSDQVLREAINGVAAFQEEGQFSLPRYEAVLKAQGMTQAVFEGRMRHDLAMQQLIGAVAEGVVVPRASAERVLAVQLEERTVSEALLDAAEYQAAVKLPADAAQKYYEGNRSRFEVPSQAKVEYVVFSKDAILAQIPVADAEARKEYDSHPERYRQGGERRASHILIQADKSAGEAAIKAAREKAEALLKEIKANPADFARLAKEHSQDPGSAAKGGDLGFFAPGAMVKPFEDATFALAKEGDVSGVVQSDFGFHIIRLTGIKPEKVRSFDEVKGEIVAELRKAEGARKYAELVDAFTNTVYEQSDSLQPAADKFKLQIQKSDWISRAGAAPAPFNNEKLLNALFSDDAVKNKRNTDAVDLGNGNLVSARIVDYKPASVRPFEEVKTAIEKGLGMEEGSKLAEKDGQAKLAQLQKGESPTLAWSQERTFQRGAQGLPPELARAVFRAPSDKLPSYAGLAVPGRGFVLFRISKVNRPAVAGDDPRLAAIQQQYARVVAEQDFGAYMAALRKRFDVKFNPAALSSAKDK